MSNFNVYYRKFEKQDPTKLGNVKLSDQVYVGKLVILPVIHTDSFCIRTEATKVEFVLLNQVEDIVEVKSLD